MLIVVRGDDIRSNEELKELYGMLVEQLNTDNGKDCMLVLPSDCSYDAITDYNSNNVKLIVKGIEARQYGKS